MLLKGKPFYLTTRAHMDQIASELLRGLPAPYLTEISTFNWIDSLANLTGVGLQQALTLNGNDYQSDFYAKSILVPESSPLTVSDLRLFLLSYL